ncbi:MAG TPA: aminotransferase class I/II-fold pyridoxal phosphate-dependent enzyme [Thermoplasmata archaeon]|nr:aminotransferase class I/II-fold pyridoxal phosphate-dependent enzyme [Thermoplasmata archaeon]HYT17364.1 aminotransferase class I/II-fold pyridoxal phosphate-dependent enzyme [Thermoplasmata archaeon]
MPWFVAKRLGLRTRAVHGRRRKRPGPIVTPIYASSTWALESARQGAEFAAATAPEAYYTRWGNPTIRELEETLADLEGGARALATGSGMGAIASAILACVDSGDHVVAGASLYTATTEIFTRLLPRFGVSTSFVDPRKPGAWKEALRSDTRLVYIETPANPTMMITDVREAVAAAKSVRATTLADNTFASPINQRPLELGVDAALHSATKYLGGHSDVVAGAIITATPRLFDRIWFTYKMLGPALGPFESFLVRRGLKTLPIRMRVQGESAQALAESLERLRAVRVVHYPGLRSFPQHALARKQMSGFGAMLSFELKGGHRAGRRFVESVKVATLAVSLGGTETLVQHPASMTHGPLTESERMTSGISEGLVRVSVGLEETDDLIEDFDQAIRKASR